jgi:hypothetical protein
VEPSGHLAYVANSGDRSISAYAIDPGTGVLVALTGLPVGTTTASPISIASTGVH